MGGLTSSYRDSAARVPSFKTSCRPRRRGSLLLRAFPVPWVDGTFSGSLPREPLMCRRVSEPQPGGRKTALSLGSDRELVFVLRIPSSLETISSAVARGLRCSSCVFVYLSLTELGTSPLLLFCRLEICNAVFVPINKKYFSDTLSRC